MPSEDRHRQTDGHVTLALNFRSFSTFWFVLFVWEFPLSRCLSSACACVALSHAVRGTRVVFGAAIALLLFALRSKTTTRVFFGFYDLELEQKTPWKTIFCWFFSFLEQKFLFTIVVVLVVSEVMVLPVVCFLFIWQQRTHSCGFRFSWMSKLLTSFLSLFGYFYLGFCGFQLILFIVCLRAFKMFWKRSSPSAAQWGNCSEICLQKLSVLFVEPVVIHPTQKFSL